MKLRLIVVMILVLFVAGCNASKKVGTQGEIVSLPQARSAIINYYENGAFEKDAEIRFKKIAEAVDKALAGGIKYPAVVMFVEDVVLSTFEVRKGQGFSENQAAAKELESHVILGLLPGMPPARKFFDYLQQHSVPVFFISSRPEGFRIPLMDNLSKEGFAGWKKIFMLPANFPEKLNYCEEIRKGLQQTGYNIIATVGVLPEDVEGEFSGLAVLLPNYIYSSR